MRIYLAGPDVFRPDAVAWAESARRQCAEFGHTALIPLDNEETTAAGIFEANVRMLRSADAVIANLNPFRGMEPDSGTCMEIGYALALGKPVVGYIADGRCLAERLAAAQGGELPRRQGRPVDNGGLLVEDFGLPVNLMLAVPLRLAVGDLRQALMML